VALCWFLFSLPLLRNVAEPKTRNQNDRSVLNNSFHALFQLRQTFRELKKYPQVLLFLLAFWAYSDGIGTIMNMATIYGREVGIGAKDLILAILLVQFLGVPCSFAFGPITDRLGAKKALILAILVYLSISIVSYFMSAAWHFWILALGVASVQGGSQAISRSIFAEMVPLNHTGEFFGLFSVSSKFAGLFGPLIFALLSEFSGGSRTSILFIIALFVLGLWLLSKLDIEAGKRQAELANLELQNSPARIV
jgi:UMF1 family MFS transporter